MSEPLQPIKWLVEPLIADGDRVVLYGEFGSFKSWVLPSLALHLAADRPWLDKFPIPQPKRVLYIDEEMHPHTLKRRIQRLALGMGQSSKLLPLRFLSRYGVRLDTVGATRLLSELQGKEFDPEVVIVETLRRVLPGNENEASDVGEFWRAVAPLAKDRTLIISHHMRKRSPMASASPRERASGSTDILAGADAAFAIQRIGADALVMECTKLREAEEPEPFVVSLYDQTQDGPIELHFDGARTQYEAEGGRTEQARRIIKSFLQVTPEQTADREAILSHADGRGVKPRTVERALGQMKRQGQLEQPVRGSYRLKGQGNAG